MSPSVYGSTRLILSSANQDLRMFSKPEVRKVKRILFGPVDHKATQKFIETELKKVISNKSEKWNFDFSKDRTLNPDGGFDWKPATPVKKLAPRRIPDSDIDPTTQYCDFSDADMIRPRPIKCSSPTQNSEYKLQQSSITDYMKAVKRPLSVCDVSKKQPSSDWNTEIPTKLPRLDTIS